MAKVHILGGGTPTPTPARFGTSYVAEVAGQQIMVDCGPAATDKLVKAGLWPTNVDYVFFTHHHFDHDVDFPCFLLCRWDQSNGSENRLEVYGPTLTEKFTEDIIGEDGVFAHDWNARINFIGSQHVFVNRGGTLPRPAPDVFAKDVAPGRVYSGENWEMKAAEAIHVQPYLDSLAYRIDSEEGSIVFTGDTEPCQAVVDLAADADLMFCMCWDEEDSMNANKENIGQTGTRGAAQMAQEAGVKKLVLAHIGANLSSHPVMEKGIGDAKGIYDGDLIFSEELMVVDV